MTTEKIRKIQSAVELLSSLTDEEWETIGKISSSKLSELMGKLSKVSCVEREKKVAELLKEIGIPVRASGYYYLKEAILLVMEDPNKYRSCIVRKLYSSIAEKDGCNWQAVERAMRYSINIAWQRGDIDKQEEVFGFTISAEKGKPTNSEAIAEIANYVKMNML